MKRNNLPEGNCMRTKKEATGPLTPADEVAIDGANAEGLQRMIRDAAIVIAETDAAERQDADVQAAKMKLKELTADYRADRKREKARIRRAYERLEQIGAA